jgi:hypothetical protein
MGLRFFLAATVWVLAEAAAFFLAGVFLAGALFAGVGTG